MLKRFSDTPKRGDEYYFDNAIDDNDITTSPMNRNSNVSNSPSRGSRSAGIVNDEIVMSPRRYKVSDNNSPKSLKNCNSVKKVEFDVDQPQSPEPFLREKRKPRRRRSSSYSSTSALLDTSASAKEDMGKRPSGRRGSSCSPIAGRAERRSRQVSISPTKNVNSSSTKTRPTLNFRSKSAGRNSEATFVQGSKGDTNGGEVHSPKKSPKVRRRHSESGGGAMMSQSGRRRSRSGSGSYSDNCAVGIDNKYMEAHSNLTRTFQSILSNASSDKVSHCQALKNVLDDLNRNKKQCTPTQRNVLLCSLSVICEGAKTELVNDLYDAVESLLAFLLNSFGFTLSSSSLDAIDEENLQRIIHLVGILTIRSEKFAKSIDESKILEEILNETTSYSLGTIDIDKKDDMSIVRQIVMRSVLACQLFASMKAELTDLSALRYVEECDAFSNAYLLGKLKESERILYNMRITLQSLVKSKVFRIKHNKVLITTSLLSHLADRCNTLDLSVCSHILKIVMIFMEQPALRELLLRNLQQELIGIFLATMRCQNTGHGDVLLKFWLTQRICQDPHYRSLIFLSEGGLNAVVTVMRGVDLEVGDSLGMLRRFCDIPLFDDKDQVTTSKIIKHLGKCLDTVEAIDLLMAMVSGLRIVDKGLAAANTFADSGLVVILLRLLYTNKCNPDLLQKYTSLLCELLQNDAIRESFLWTRDNGFHYVSSAFISCCGITNQFLSLLQVVEVLAVDSSIHECLFDGGIVISLADHIQNTLSNNASPDAVTLSHVLRVLRIFDIMTLKSTISCKRFKQMKFEVFISLLVHHEDPDVRRIVIDILKRLGSCTTPSEWQNLFKNASQFNNIGQKKRSTI